MTQPNRIAGRSELKSQIDIRKCPVYYAGDTLVNSSLHSVPEIKSLISKLNRRSILHSIMALILVRLKLPGTPALPSSEFTITIYFLRFFSIFCGGNFMKFAFRLKLDYVFTKFMGIKDETIMNGNI